MRIVFWSALATLAVSVLLFGLALPLIPTDLGNTYLLGAYLFLASAAIIFAIGQAGKTILKAVQSLQISRAEVSAIAHALVVPAEADPVEPEKPKSGPALAAGMAGVAAGMAAGAALGGLTRADQPGEPASMQAGLEPLPDSSLVITPSRDEKLLDDLERDLFAEISAEKRPSAELTSPLEEGLLHAGPAAQSLPLEEPEEDMRPLTVSLTGAPAEEPAPTGPALVETATEPEEPVETLVGSPESERIKPMEDMAGKSVSVTMDLVGPATDVAPAADTLAPVSPVEPEGGAPAGTTPGLIADDDLAALTDDEPGFAPLESLDVVGAYDSGGTRFTMYSDGSVTAVGERINRRFRSLEALRGFIDGGMRN
jgi:hypothetical protein